MTRVLLRGIAAAAVATAALALTACASLTPASAAPDPLGAWGDDGVRTEPSLNLTDDGRLSGTDGCNRLMGSWTATDDGVEFGQVASTMMFCQGVDTWLSRLHHATIDGDTMTVLDESGTAIGTLVRASAG